MSAVIGGTVSKISGGKFANGAPTGAFQYLLNQAAQAIKTVWPTNHNIITSGFSQSRVDPVTGQTSRPHTAIDIKNPNGDPVYSIMDGVVVEVSSSQSAGNHIKVDHGNGYESSYSHTDSSLNVNDIVVLGQTIGLSDSSGRISGPYLHFVLRQSNTRVNPCTVLNCPS